jgi:hypothetical protein
VPRTIDSCRRVPSTREGTSSCRVPSRETVTTTRINICMPYLYSRMHVSLMTKELASRHIGPQALFVDHESIRPLVRKQACARHLNLFIIRKDLTPESRPLNFMQPEHVNCQKSDGLEIIPQRRARGEIFPMSHTSLLQHTSTILCTCVQYPTKD